MESILHIAFNQDGSCFCLGTRKGFIVYSTSPIQILSQRDFNEGISIVEMLKKTNILALVGEDDLDKKDSEFSSDKLIIWDDLLNKRISELILNSEIVNVKIKLDKIIAVTKNNFLYVVEISDLEIKNIFQIYQSYQWTIIF